MTGKIFVITPEGDIREEDYPTGGLDNEYKTLTSLIGGKCERVERVLPTRLYTALGGNNNYPSFGGCRPNMLVDEDFYEHLSAFNIVGSWLYMTDQHGYSILGNIIIAGETKVEDGLDYCGLNDDQYALLKPQLERLCKKARENHEITSFC